MSESFKNASVQIRLVLSIAARDAPKRCAFSVIICAILAAYAGLPSALTCGLLILLYEGSSRVLHRTMPLSSTPIGTLRTVAVVVSFAVSTFSYGLPGVLLMQQPFQAAQFAGLLWITGMAIHIVGAHASIVLIGWATAVFVFALLSVGVATTHQGPLAPFSPFDWGAVSIVGIFWAGNMIEVLKAQEENRKAFGQARYLSEERLKKLDFLASHDALTGLLNRRAFDEALQDAIDFGQEVGVALIDLDQFKEINDTMGHGAGDAVLCAQAARLETAFGQGNVARLGGDEFAALLRDTADKAAIDEAIGGLRVRLCEPVAYKGQPLRVGASVGLAFGTYPEATVEGLCTAADAAMYREKKSRREVPATRQSQKPRM